MKITELRGLIRQAIQEYLIENQPAPSKPQTSPGPATLPEKPKTDPGKKPIRRPLTPPKKTPEKRPNKAAVNEVEKEEMLKKIMNRYKSGK